MKSPSFQTGTYRLPLPNSIKVNAAGGLFCQQRNRVGSDVDSVGRDGLIRFDNVLNIPEQDGLANVAPELLG